MPVIPPWIATNPLDFIRAAQAGGGLGIEAANVALRRRALDLQGAEQGGRLNLGYAELAQRAALEQAQREQAAARLKQAMAQQESMNHYRDLLEQNRQRDDLRAAEALKSRQAMEQQGLDLRELIAGNQQDYRKAALDLSKQRVDLEKERIDKSGAGSKLAQALKLIGGQDTGVTTPVVGNGKP